MEKEAKGKIYRRGKKTRTSKLLAFRKRDSVGGWACGEERRRKSKSSLGSQSGRKQGRGTQPEASVMKKPVCPLRSGEKGIRDGLSEET